MYMFIIYKIHCFASEIFGGGRYINRELKLPVIEGIVENTKRGCRAVSAKP
jgi:hypothetical protein